MVDFLFVKTLGGKYVVASVEQVYYQEIHYNFHFYIFVYNMTFSPTLQNFNPTQPKQAVNFITFISANVWPPLTDVTRFGCDLEESDVKGSKVTCRLK